jgi:5-methylcytosine-specific restriction endonuclease McrA
MVVLTARLDEETGAILLKALEAAREALYYGRRAAMINKNVSAETSHTVSVSPGIAPELAHESAVYLPSSVLAETDGRAAGQSTLEDSRVSADTARRLVCDATRVVMRHDADGHVTEVGARTRTIPPALRRALEHRDRGCRFPGCGLPYGQGHHIRHWAHGGPTTLSNLVMLCRRHHRSVHEEGYQIERQPNGELRFKRPDGEVLPHVPPS